MRSRQNRRNQKSVKAMQWNDRAVSSVIASGEDLGGSVMKFLLIALALSLGFCGTCFAQSSPKNACHMEGAQLICKQAAQSTAK
jgi:hypothetical protein